MIIFATWNNRIAWLILLRFNLVSFPIEGSPWYDLDWWRNDYRHNTRFRIEEKVLGIWSDGTWLCVQNQGNMCGLVYVFYNPFHATENFLYPYFAIENLVIPPLPLSFKFSPRNVIVDRFQWVNCWKKTILLLFFFPFSSPRKCIHSVWLGFWHHKILVSEEFIFVVDQTAFTQENGL
jgi:hypothetical protein